MVLCPSLVLVQAILMENGVRSICAKVWTAVSMDDVVSEDASATLGELGLVVEQQPSGRFHIQRLEISALAVGRRAQALVDAAPIASLGKMTECGLPTRITIIVVVVTQHATRPCLDVIVLVAPKALRRV